MLVVENSVGWRQVTVRAESHAFNSPAPISSLQVIYKIERECAWCLEMASKLAEVILQPENWNVFLDHNSYVEIARTPRHEW